MPATIIPKSHSIVTKTGTHPMRIRLRLFLEWGVTFGGPYNIPEKADRFVAYANKQELELVIVCRHARMPAASGAAPASNKADVRRGQQADPLADHHSQEPPDGQRSLHPWGYHVWLIFRISTTPA